MNTITRGKVSVILPAFNSQRFLPQSIDSVLRSQESVDLELIIVNDGSSDATGAIAKAYAMADTRVKVITQSNAGLSAARNAGMEAAEGEYITFIDSDDILLPDSIGHMLALLDDDTDVVSGRFYRGTTRAAARVSREGRERVSTLSGYEAVKQMLYQRGMSCNAWGRIYRRSSIGGLRFTDGIYYEDLDFNYRLFPTLKKLKFTSRHVYFYRVVPESLTGMWSPKRLDVMKVTEAIEADAVSRHDPLLIAAARDRRMAAAFNMFALADINGATDAATECWREICRLRHDAFRDPAIRLKDRLGIMVSLLGPRVTSLLGRLVYR